MSGGWKRGSRLLVAIAAACSPIPSLEFVSDAGPSAPPGDASLPPMDSGGDDAGSGDDGPPTIDPSPGDDGGADDGGDEASIQCGATFVAACTACPGSPIHCTRGTQNVCVSDCTACGSNSLPCYHCNGNDGGLRGTCVAVQGTGTIACSANNLCACDSVQSCPTIEGAAETCNSVSGAKGLRCLTCGAPGTDGEPCERASGAMGTCRVTDGAAPACQ